MKLNKMATIRMVAWSLALVTVVGLFIAVNSLGVHALKVRAEITSMPAGIAKIIDIGGKPPKGLLNPKGNRTTALTINTDIEFGNVFPGETQSGEFIVYLGDPENGSLGPYSRVEYHLILGTQGGYLDLSPYLTVIRDETENDVEPDAVTSASLDSDLGDTVDRWVVTMTLPDDPPGGDYWTTIVVWVDETFPP